MTTAASSLRLLAVCLGLVLLAGCAATPQTDAVLRSAPTPTLPEQQELTKVPFHAQKRYQCGPAALATLLEYSNVNVTPAQLVPQVYVPKRKGSFQVEMLAAARRHERLAYRPPPELDTLLRTVAAGQPVLVLQNLGLSWYQKWHYAVVVGYDLPKQKIILRSGEIKRYEISLQLFERTWARSHYWSMVVLKPGQLPVAGEPERYFRAAAAFEQHAKPLDSLKAWQAGALHWPNSTELQMGYGNFLYNQQDHQGAEQHYRQVITNHPDYAPAYNNLAQVLIDEKRFKAAIPLAERAVELGGEHAQLYQQTLDEARRGAAHSSSQSGD